MNKDNSPQLSKPDLKEHWNTTYSKNPIEKLGWYERDLSPSLKLIELCKLDPQARILNIGAGSSTLIDELLMQGYTNLIATDISEVALRDLDHRTGGSDYLECITDDLTHPDKLNEIDGVDLWIDRAVLHFFVELKDKKAYFNLLKEKVKKDGFVILAEFNLEGAEKCSGLPVCRYSEEDFKEHLGPEFKLIEAFDYTYEMPSGGLRPYIYTLYKRI